MPKFNYVRNPVVGDVQQWALDEFASVERSLASIPATLYSEDVAGTTYTLVLGDQDKVKTTTSSSDVTITIPPQSSVPFEVGTMVYFYQGGAGTSRLAEGAGVTLNSRPGLISAGQHALFFVWKKADDVWVASGDLTAIDIATTPTAGALVIAGYAPSIKTNRLVNPTAGSLSITGYAPSIT